MSTLKASFGKRLKKVRNQKNITQEHLAENIGLSVESISNIERGIHAPSFKTLEKLAQSLKIPVKDLFDFED